MIDKSRAGMDPRIIATLLFLSAVPLLIFTLAMNYKFAQTVALTEGGQMIRGYTALAMDVFGAVLVAAAGFAWAAKHRWLGGITFGFALFFLSYSAWNVAGFGATERLGAEQYRTKLEKAAEARRKERTEAFREQAQWARSTAVEQRGVDSKRALMGESTAILEKAFNEPVRVDKELPPDAQATLASDITGKDSSWFQKADVIALAILLIAGKAIGFGLAPLYLPRKESVAKEATRPAPPAQEVAANAPFTKPARPVASVEPSGQEKRLDSVARFFAEWTRPTTGTATISAESLLASYNQWARINKTVELKQNGFGRLVNMLAEAGRITMSRRNSGQETVYSGFELIPAKDRAVVTLNRAA